MEFKLCMKDLNETGGRTGLGSDTLRGDLCQFEYSECVELLL